MNISLNGYKNLNSVIHMLQYTYGLLFVVAGADKFLNLVTQWSKYLSPAIIAALPLEIGMIMKLVGIIEICIGLLLLFTHYTRLGAILVATWFAVIVLNLLTMKGIYLDIAVRDIVMAMGACALACLINVKHEIIQ